MEAEDTEASEAAEGVRRDGAHQACAGEAEGIDGGT